MVDGSKLLVGREESARKCQGPRAIAQLIHRVARIGLGAGLEAFVDTSALPGERCYCSTADLSFVHRGGEESNGG